MIHVIAHITVKRGLVNAFLREFRELAILVRQEAGCLDYLPTQDVRTGLEIQDYHPECVTILEKWASRAALEAHLRSGHMRAFQERIKDIVVETRLKIVEEV
jgi:quinol monooxygenase YgiN